MIPTPHYTILHRLVTTTATFVLVQLAAVCNVDAELHIESQSSPTGTTAVVVDGTAKIFDVVEPNAGLIIVQPMGRTQVSFKEVEGANRDLTFRGGAAPGLVINQSFRSIYPGLIERTVTVTAEADQRYFLDLEWKAVGTGAFYSFLGEEPSTKRYSPGCGGPEFKEQSSQTFPMAGYREGDIFYGVIGDTPGLWENRSFLKFDVERRALSIATGDGSPKRVISIPRELDATTDYRATFDGWQHIESGETQEFKTWIFSAPVKSLYDIQLATHLALANAKGFNQSALEAILRNTSYLLLRRNLLRPESDYLFISGVGYGWKQWVSDGFWMSRGLDNAKIDAAAMAAVFFERLNYEDNSQYYLIWACLVKRDGGDVDPRTLRRAYDFIRAHEKNGLYIPPRLMPDKLIAKTYHDQLPYDDDDAPSSNQGFHCGALLAAKELGFPVTNEEIELAIEGYIHMYNKVGGYMATSLKQQEHVGQDSLYGEVLTYAVFGRKLLPDDVVRSHLETSVRIQSPYGMRVISKANGELLDGHSGSYVFGGSWFLNDGANYLDGLIHGMDPVWVDKQLMWRLEKELAWMPAFHESISTVTGKPHGHHLYSWNSGFWWLRREIRKRLVLSGPDPLEAALDKRLGVIQRDGQLILDPAQATLRPSDPIEVR